MSRKINIASVQMDAAPAPTATRLARAGQLVGRAAAGGAQLIVLPEVFNTGYTYSETNYARAEPPGGPTLTWMKETAAKYDIHLAGTFLLLSGEDIYNSMFIVAPDGRTWRYDKHYPWFYERAYFREGHDITIADTELGRFGMMVCWDQAHPELWARYAGRVDLMVICSSPPRFDNPVVVFPDGEQIDAAEAGPFWRLIKDHPNTPEMFGEQLRKQAANLSVPVVNAAGAGIFCSTVPLPRLSLLGFLLTRPDLWNRLNQARATHLTTAGYYNETFVADAEGNVLAHVPEGEDYVIAEVTLAGEMPYPRRPQPRAGIAFPAYLMGDYMTALMVPVYRQGIRAAYGPQMAYNTRVWFIAAMGMLLAGYLLGRVGGRRQP